MAMFRVEFTGHKDIEANSLDEAGVAVKNLFDVANAIGADYCKIDQYHHAPPCLTLNKSKLFDEARVSVSPLKPVDMEKWKAIFRNELVKGENTWKDFYLDATPEEDRFSKDHLEDLFEEARSLLDDFVEIIRGDFDTKGLGGFVGGELVSSADDKVYDIYLNVWDITRGQHIKCDLRFILVGTGTDWR